MNDMDYELLGMTEEEYQQKEKEFRQALRDSVRKYRSDILFHIKRTYNIPTDQDHLRMMSWYYISSPDAKYIQDINTWHIASSKQDVYHLQHLSHAFFLSIEKPGLENPCIQAQMSIVKNWIEVEPDEMKRLENQQVFFEKLHSLIPRLEDACKRITLETINERLDRIEKLLLRTTCKP